MNNISPDLYKGVFTVYDRDNNYNSFSIVVLPFSCNLLNGSKIYIYIYILVCCCSKPSNLFQYSKCLQIWRSVE